MKDIKQLEQKNKEQKTERLRKEYKSFVTEIVNTLNPYKGNIITYLQHIQSQYNYLPAPALEMISEQVNKPLNQIYSIAGFYKQFRFTPAGKHMVKVCIGTACHVKGAENIFTSFRDELSIPDLQDTDSKGLFSVTKVACLGCCMLAPVVQIDDQTFAYTEINGSGSIIETFLKNVKDKSRRKTPPPKSGQKKAAKEILLCQCSSCIAAGSGEIKTKITDTIKTYKLDMELRSVGCTGFSYKAPYLEIHENKKAVQVFGNVKEDDIESILLEHAPGKNMKAFIGRLINIVSEAVLRPDKKKKEENDSYTDDEAYTKTQKQVATKHAGLLNPLNLKEYKESGGFESLTHLPEDPQQIINQLTASGLRGRGGGGFFSGRKWQQVYDAEGKEKYIICNADEGDPGAFMDRLILESFPFRVLEGIIAACYTLQAETAIIYVRAEYALAAERIKKAICICETQGIFGKEADSIKLQNIEILVLEGAGAFVCGEETALIAAVQGERGIPRTRPPFPSEKGLWAKPTLINNVETYSLIPQILMDQDFHLLGTKHSKGTKTFALAGKIKRSGLIEVPMGITINEIVKTIAGGMEEGSLFKAVQIGGPAGGCIPSSLGGHSIDYDSLKKVGAIMGSGGLVVLDQHDCMVEMARYFMEFAVDESCGRCVSCRVGTKRMLDLLTKMTEGNASEYEFKKLIELAEITQTQSCCGLGKTSVNPFLSGLRHFEDEYKAHLEKRCPAKQCTKLITYKIDQSLCIGCTKCAQVCPTDAIEAQPYMKHFIKDDLCIKCGSCKTVCPKGAADVY